MKVSQLRNELKGFLKNSSELSELDTALARLDNMPIVELAKKLKSIPAPMIALDKIADELKRQIGDAKEFDEKLETLVQPRAFNKTMVVELYDLVFSSRSKLNSKMTKKQMVEKFKAQHRREVNFRTA